MASRYRGSGVPTRGNRGERMNTRDMERMNKFQNSKVDAAREKGEQWWDLDAEREDKYEQAKENRSKGYQKRPPPKQKPQ